MNSGNFLIENEINKNQLNNYRRSTEITLENQKLKDEIEKLKEEILNLQERNNDLERSLYDIEYRGFIIKKDMERRNKV